MTDTSGKEMNTNAPVMGCEGCNTTAGRSGCSKHNNMENIPNGIHVLPIVLSPLKAWKVYKSNYCNPDEHIGYFQTLPQAEQAKQDYIDAENKRCGRFLGAGICCNKIKDVLIEEIEIV